MYEIQHRRTFDELKPTEPIHKNIKTLSEAKAIRYASGDLVIETETNKIVCSEEWLFEWEKKDPNSFAKKMISLQIKFNKGN